MNEVKTNENLISFWNSVFEMSDEQKQEAQQTDPESWKTDLPSQKLFDAANSLISKNKGRIKKDLVAAADISVSTGGENEY